MSGGRIVHPASHRLLLPGKLVQQNMGDRRAEATWACSVVLASGAVRGQCPGRVHHFSCFSCFWPRMHQLCPLLRPSPLLAACLAAATCFGFHQPLPDRFPPKMSEIRQLHPFAQQIAAHQFQLMKNLFSYKQINRCPSRPQRSIDTSWQTQPESGTARYSRFQSGKARYCAEKTHHVLYFWKAGASRISNMIL